MTSSKERCWLSSLCLRRCWTFEIGGLESPLALGLAEGRKVEAADPWPHALSY